MERSGQFHALAALFTGNEPPVCVGEWTFPEPVWKLWRKVFAPAGNRTRILLPTSP
jgi:hypothetical protein